MDVVGHFLRILILLTSVSVFFRMPFLWAWAVKAMLQAFRFLIYLCYFIYLGFAIHSGHSESMDAVLLIMILAIESFRFKDGELHAWSEEFETKSKSAYSLKNLLGVSGFQKKNSFEENSFKNRAGQNRPFVLMRAASSKAPCILMVHGGAYWYGDHHQQLDFLTMLNNLGYHVISLSYGLLPNEIWPAQKFDLEDFFGQKNKTFNNLGIEPEFLVWAGRSAGAHLAAHMAYTASDKSVKGVINIFGLSDLTAFKNIKLDPVQIYKKLKLLFGEQVQDEMFLNAVGIIGNIEKRKDLPMLLIHGQMDSLVPFSQSQNLKHALQNIQAKGLSLFFRWEDHCLEYNLATPAGTKTIRACRIFLEALKK